MNDEKKFFALMGLVEEQIKASQLQQQLVENAIDELKQARNEIAHSVNQRIEKQVDVQLQQFNHASDSLHKTNHVMQNTFRKMNWTWNIRTTLFGLFICLLGLSAVWGYGKLRVDYFRDLEAAVFKQQQTIKKLNVRGGGADLRTCQYQEKDYTCIRVMKSWGGYGKNGDLFIIDPK